MKTNTSLLTTMAVLATALPFTTQAAPQIYDLKADWSSTNNPNGAWEYRSHSEYWDQNVLMSSYGGSGWGHGWMNEFGGLEWTTIRQATDDTVVPLPGELEPGDIYVVSRKSDLYTPDAGIVRWTAPADGSIDLSGALWEVGYYSSWELFFNPKLGSASTLSYGYTSHLSTRSNPADISAGGSWNNNEPFDLLNIPVQGGDQVNLFIYTEYDLPAGVNFTVTFTPDPIDPVTAIEDLALAVVDMNLQNGIENSLDNKLDAALAALNDVVANNDGAAINTLQSFINAVEAQRGSKLTDAQADQLIAAAQEIQSLLSSP